MRGRRRIRRLIGRLVQTALALLVVGGVVLWATNLDFRFVARAAAEEGWILARARPIAKLVGDPDTDPALRGKLELVLAARQFAAESLGLQAGETYTRYAAIGRDTLLLVLSASRYDRLLEETWSFPIVGRVPYRGFFDVRDAQRAAARLRQQGMDAYLRPAGAFSTLGWFDDPLLSTVVRTDSVEIVTTVIHEILHNSIYLKSRAPFNESLANFVGHRGAEAFFRFRGDTLSAGRAAARWRDEVRLSGFYGRLAARLRAMYAPGLAGEPLRAERERAFSEAVAELRGPLGRELETLPGAVLAERSLNNAVVIANLIYRTRLSAFDSVLAADGQSVSAAIAAIVTEASGAADPWAALSRRPPGRSQRGRPVSASRAVQTGVGGGGRVGGGSLVFP